MQAAAKASRSEHPVSFRSEVRLPTTLSTLAGMCGHIQPQTSKCSGFIFTLIIIIHYPWSHHNNGSFSSSPKDNYANTAYLFGGMMINPLYFPDTSLLISRWMTYSSPASWLDYLCTVNIGWNFRSRNFCQAARKMRSSVRWYLRLIWRQKLRRGSKLTATKCSVSCPCPFVYDELVQTIFPLCIPLHLMTAVLQIQAKSSSVTVLSTGKKWLCGVTCSVSSCLIILCPTSSGESDRVYIYLVCECVLGSLAWFFLLLLEFIW